MKIPPAAPNTAGLAHATTLPAPAVPPSMSAPVGLTKPVSMPTVKPVAKVPLKRPMPTNHTSTSPAFSSKKVMSPHSTREFLYKLLDGCGDIDVSDLHVHPDTGMWRLVHGNLKKTEDAESLITEDEIIHWMTHSEGYEDMGVDSPEKLLGTKGHTTVAFDTGTWRVRGSFRRSTVGVSCTFRLIPSTIPSVTDVYLPEVMMDMVKRKSGLILIEGPTGSGKTTSIAALIDYINETTDLHIYSVEDPIEFVHKPKGNTVFTMREIGVHASDYPSAVENALRSKPNIIFVGEMLNNETKKSALHASTTGHLVITTAHAGSVTEAIDSFIGEFSADEQPQIRGRLSTSLLGVMCQSLVPTIDGKLVAAREIMLTNENFAEIIMDGKMNMIAAQMESGSKCQSMEDDLGRLVKENLISIDTALAYAKRPETLRNEFVRQGYLVD